MTTGNERAAVDMQTVGELPAFSAGDRVEAIDAVVAGADENAAVRHAGTGFDMAGRPELPQLATGGGIQAKEAGLQVRVHPLANVQAAAAEAGGGIHVLQRAVVVEGPDHGAVLTAQ